jgi:hypothetical protein
MKDNRSILQYCILPSLWKLAWYYAAQYNIIFSVDSADYSSSPVGKHVSGCVLVRTLALLTAPVILGGQDSQYNMPII